MPISAAEKMKHFESIMNNFPVKKLQLDLKRYLPAVSKQFVGTVNASLEDSSELPEGYWLCDIENEEVNLTLDKAVQTMVLIACMQKQTKILHERLQLEKATAKQLMWEVQDIPVDFDDFELSIEQRIAHLPVKEETVFIKLSKALLFGIEELLSDANILSDFENGELSDSFKDKLAFDEVDRDHQVNVKHFLTDLSNEFQSDETGDFAKSVRSILSDLKLAKTIRDDEDAAQALRFIASSKIDVESFNSP